MPFRLALSGINAASAELQVTANNIANTNTTGFKGSRAEFAELFAVSPFGVSANATGNGVRLAAVSQQFSQGNVDFTTSNLDLALSGQGYFTLNNAGSIEYTRAGAFGVDRDGFVTNAQNARLQVYPPVGNGNFNTGSLTDLRLLTNESAPQASTRIETGVNLPGNATPPANPVFDADDPTSYNHTTSLTVYDSLGAPHTATMYFVRDAVDNAWTTHLTIDGNAVGGGQALQFGQNGLLQAPANGNLVFPSYTPGGGAADLDLTVNFSNTTQYGAAFTIGSMQQDGFTTGRLVGIDISATGVVQARYTNGQSTPLGQVALANFSNPQGLQQVGDTAWTETFDSGPVLRGQAGSSNFGMIQSGALEASNVDLTAQLVSMITAQRNFQANAQMISAADNVTQTILNIR